MVQLTNTFVAGAARLRIAILSRPFCSTTPRATKNDTICEMASSNIRFGPGATSEVGSDLRDMGAESVIVFADPNVAKLPPMRRLMESLDRHGVRDVEVFDRVRVEPSDASLRDAIDFVSSRRRSYDAVVALGGGSTIDTAKVANLYACHPPPGGDFYHYVNPPLGRGAPVPGPIKPLVAIPTTAGTGSETTGVAIFDDAPTRSKTGIAHRRLRPTLGVVDPDNTATLPPEVAKFSGLDVLCHAIESYTALPYTERPAPERPLLRPAYQGSNPYSDVWSLHALRVAATYLPRAVFDPSDTEARSQMLLASSAAGVGFGNAGVHLCHGMSYPVASQVKGYVPPGYGEVDHPLVPHGHSVIVNAPAVFRFTGGSNPGRHLECARILAAARGAPNPLAAESDAGLLLSDEILKLMVKLDVPVGLRTLGYDEEDVQDLVEGTLPQHRVTKLSPRPVGRDEIVGLFQDALSE